MINITRIRHAHSKIVHALRYQYGTLFGHTDYGRFAIVGNARTGSNFLLDGIVSSKSVYMFHEIFADHNRQLGTNFDQIISSLYGKKEKRVKQVGVKIFYYHLTENEWAKFMTHNEFKIIHLVRLNRLRTIISLEIALKTDQWVATPFSNIHPKDKSVSIDTSTLIEQIEKIDYFEKITRERFKDLQFLEVAYEDITGNPQDEFKKIESFLSLRNIDPGAIRHKKQNPESLRDLITNYDEVEQVLIGTPHEIYLKNNLTT